MGSSTIQRSYPASPRRQPTWRTSWQLGGVAASLKLCGQELFVATLWLTTSSSNGAEGPRYMKGTDS
uniref:Uncharacterized protein n=1 Tax=Physcomitrium patens TaxID=3218 RepID=A0A2K1KFA7_PHYPA|nr:hypothetical protein PHYPA_008827 [Physcomitrium patens]